MITVELTEDHLEILTEGAQRYGRIAVGLKSADGFTDVVVVHTRNHRRGRPVKAASKVGSAARAIAGEEPK